MRSVGLTMLAVGLLTLPGAAAEGELEAARKQISDLDLEFCKATIAKDQERFASFIADEAVFFGSGGPAVGRQAVVEDWAPFFQEGGPTLTWEPTEAVVFEGGELGYTNGRYVLKQTDAEGTTRTGRGFYHTVWRKQTDGSWKVVADIGTRPVPAD